MCEHIVESGFELKRHTQQHIDNMPAMDLTCHSCEIEFSSEKKLELHIKF